MPPDDRVAAIDGVTMGCIDEVYSTIAPLVDNEMLKMFVLFFESKLRQSWNVVLPSNTVVPYAGDLSRIYYLYHRCKETIVDSNDEYMPCYHTASLDEKKACAAEHCARTMIAMLPAILERLGITTILSRTVIY